MMYSSAIRALTFLLVTSVLQAQSLSKGDEAAPNEKHSDAQLSFEIPKGAKVLPSKEKGTYYISLPPAEDRMCVLIIHGKAEPPEFSQKRAEASMKDALGKVGVETEDGAVKVICREVSKVSRHSIGNGEVYSFQFKADMSQDGKTQQGGGIVGFGAIDGRGVFFQVSGLLREGDESILKAILSSCRFSSKG